MRDRHTSDWPHFLACFFGLILAMAPACGQALSLHRSDNGAGVPVMRAEQQLARSGLLARMMAGESLKIHGLKVTAQGPAQVYWTTSSEFVVAAVLTGALATGEAGQTIGPGEMAVLPIAPGGLVRVDHFDARQFLASAPRLDAAARTALADAAQAQSDRVWWGSLERTILNVQSPAPPLVEAVRRDYLLEPEIVRVRQQAGADVNQLARLVASRFIAAMERRDIDAVRALLHPTLFLSQDRGPGGNWLARRHAFATQLARGPLSRSLKGARVGVDDEGRMIATAPGGRRWELVISALDASVFIAAVEPRP